MADKLIVNNKNEAPIFYIMGVSGSGKSTIGQQLANSLEIPFFDGDDYHPEQNVQKMAAGNPLNDEDRLGWLQTLNSLAKDNSAKGAVIACSALKEKYRIILANEIEERVVWVYLQGSFEEISQFLAARKGHFMPPTLLHSQLDTLEEPKHAITISIRNSPNAIVGTIVQSFGDYMKKPS